MRKVRIKGLPKAANGGNQSSKSMSGPNNGLRRFLEGKKNFDSGMNQFSAPELEVNKSISAVDPSEANIEAEGGEFAVVPGRAGIPESYNINGPRHNNGGVPLNLAEDSFIFSDTRGMKIKDPEILAEFGISVPKKGKVKGYTPSQLAKKYNLNDYKKVLMDPNSDKLERETAEKMIENFNMKLGKLALVQESQKGFPQEVPVIAQPYLQSIGQDPTQFAQQDLGQGQGQPPVAAYGAGVVGDPQQYSYNYGGENKAMSKRFPGLDVAEMGGQFDGAFWKSILQAGGAIPQPEIASAETIITPSQTSVAGQDTARPEGYEGDYYHYNVSEDDYYKTLMDRLKNTFARNANPRKIRQTTVFQDGGQNLPEYQDAGSVLYKGEEVPMTEFQPGVSDEGRRMRQPMVPFEPYEEPLYPEIAAAEPKAKVQKTTVKAYNIPKNAIVHDATAAGYDANKVKKGEYVKHADGKINKATGEVEDPNEYKQLERIPEISRKAYSKSYALLNKTLTDASNKEMTDVLYEKYKDRISKGKIDDARKEKLKNMSKEDVIKNMMRAQEQIYAITAAANEDPELMKRLESGAMDSRQVIDPVTKKRYGKNEAYKDILKTLGYSDEDILTDDEIAAFQGAYQGLADVSKDPKYKNSLKDFNLKPVGVSDQEWEGETNISPVDDWFGNTTIGQAAVAKDSPTMGFEEADLVAEKESVLEKINPEYEAPLVDAPWWAQDVGNQFMTVAERASLKKYNPWSSPIDLQSPGAVYYDPSRAVAASAEQAAIAAQTIGAFAGPQGTAQLTGVQGEGFKQAANTLADYEAKNVGIANQYLAQRNQVANQEHLANAERLQRLYDQQTIANQQFDNSKRAANRNVFEAWRQGLTNATKTQTLNALYPQYSVDPETGGKFAFTKGRPQTPGGSTANSSKQIDTAYKEFIRQKGWDNTPQSYTAFRKDQGLDRSNRGFSTDPDAATRNEFLRRRFS